MVLIVCAFHYIIKPYTIRPKIIIWLWHINYVLLFVKKIRKRIDGIPFLKETEIVNALLNILACGQKERMAKNCRERYEKRYRLAYMRDRINLLL